MDRSELDLYAAGVWEEGGVRTILLACLVIAGCQPQGPQPNGSIGVGIAEIRTVKLEDGTRCAVAIRAGAGGPAISCDWEAK